MSNEQLHNITVTFEVEGDYSEAQDEADKIARQLGIEQSAPQELTPAKRQGLIRVKIGPVAVQAVNNKKG